MKQPLKLDQRGFVSMITVILISLLLLLVTTTMVTIEVAQLRKASDTEQSMRAYYTAEAGVENAVKNVLNGTIVADQPCTRVAYDTAEWTCQQVELSGQPTGKLPAPNAAVTVDPGFVAAPGYNSVKIEWDQSPNVNPGYYSTTNPLPSQAVYDGSLPFAPPLEITTVQYPAGNVTAGEVCVDGIVPPACKMLIQNALFLPGGAALGTINYGAAAAYSTGGPYFGNCSALRTPYHCQVILNGFNGANAHMFRLQSRYGASAYRMTFYTGNNASGAVVDVPDGTATIDVTAKAGNTFRRVITKVPSPQAPASGLNYVIFSDTGVCKDFSVLGNAFPGGGYTCP